VPPVQLGHQQQQTSNEPQIEAVEPEPVVPQKQGSDSDTPDEVNGDERLVKGVTPAPARDLRRRVPMR